MQFDPNRTVGYEAGKAHRYRCQSGFYEEFVRGDQTIDVGFRGGIPNALPVFEGCLGIELGSPGYDGLRLPVEDGSADAVHASHVLEHVFPPGDYLREWFRAIRVGGVILLFVPHACLYERRKSVPPSRWSPEHLMSFTPASLLSLIENTLEDNTYRIRHLRDNDAGYDYSLSSTVHPTGCLEIECVIEKIPTPRWRVEP